MGQEMNRTPRSTETRRLSPAQVWSVLLVVVLTNAMPATLGCILLLNGWTPKTVGERAVLADMVLTAYVRRAYKHERRADHTYSAELSVLRVLKGQHILDLIPPLPAGPTFYNMSNFGDKVMCYAEVDEGETYVLFATTYEGRLSAKYDDIFGAVAEYSSETEDLVLGALGWDAWSGWSPCSATCGAGRQTRRRNCLKQKAKICEGAKGQKRNCNSFHCQGTHDILALLDIASLPLGVSVASDRQTAFTLGTASDLTLPTPQIFPRFWPRDFSIIITARPQVGNRGFLLTLADTMGAVRLGIQVGDNIVFEYHDEGDQPGQTMSPQFDIDLSDGAWHQMAFSVRGQTITLHVDCIAEIQQTLPRSRAAQLPLNTVLSVGKPYVSDPDHPAYEGDVEQLTITDDPEAASLQCSHDADAKINGEGNITTSAPSRPTRAPVTTAPPTSPSPPVIVLSWSAWSACSATCGEGVQTRTTFCVDNAGSFDACVRESEAGLETRRCFYRECPARCRYRCENGGQCVRPGRCVCRHGYYGVRCHLVSCFPGCYNGGYCQKPDVCNCTSGYTGRQCQQARCEPPCANGGRCIRPSVCACPYGFRPPTCTPTCHVTCHNGGICVGPNRCRCQPGFVGRQCQTPVCRQHCQNGGKCVAPDKCSCSWRYSGTDCSIAQCYPPCSNGGMCISGRYCLCPPNTFGRHCEKPLCPAGCLHGGTCTAFNVCVCPPGYLGYRCEKVNARCPHRCKHGGRCVSPGRCRCPREYHGRYCQFRRCTYVAVQRSYVTAVRQLHKSTYFFPCGPWGRSKCARDRHFYKMIYKIHFKTTYRCKVS